MAGNEPGEPAEGAPAEKTPSRAERAGELLGTAFTRAERSVRRRGRKQPKAPDAANVQEVGGAPGTAPVVEGETQELRPLPDVTSATNGPDGSDAARPANDVLAGARTAWADPAMRRKIVLGAAGVALLVLLAIMVPALARRGAGPETGPVVTEPGQAPAEAPPAAEAPPPAEGQPPAEQPAGTAPAEPTPLRQAAIAALPLLLGLFWLLSAWLVDAEARRAFVVQEPWGERRTVAYTTLAVGCVFPLILAGLIFSAWGFVTFVLDVSRRQNPVAGLQAGALILMACAGLLVLRGLIARWLDQRRANRA